MDPFIISAIVASIIQGAQDILGKIGVVFSNTIVVVLTIAASVGVTIYKAIETGIKVFSLTTLVILIQVLIGAIGGNVATKKTLHKVGIHG